VRLRQALSTDRPDASVGPSHCNPAQWDACRAAPAGIRPSRLDSSSKSSSKKRGTKGASDTQSRPDRHGAEWSFIGIPEETVRPQTDDYALTANSGVKSEYLVACYHDGMSRKVTTIRMPREIADQVEAVARGRGVSVNTVVLEALASEIQRVKMDKEFMARLREITKRDKEILDRLAR